MFCEHFAFLSALQKTANRHEKEADKRESSSSSSSSSAASSAGFACVVCADEYPISFSIPCNGDEMHFLCRVCFHSNATITNEKPITSVACPMPKCGALFGTHVARTGVSAWEAFQLQLKNDEVDQRVAMAAVAQLHCPCGTVAVVAKEDVGNGIVVCPGCIKSYCIKCGNFSHGNKPCPPPADTMKWLQKHAKPCPNCNNQIQKNGGCDHMTCQRSAGGCGYQFWFSCGCPYSGHKPGCGRPGER
jgi:ariadne-1